MVKSIGLLLIRVSILQALRKEEKHRREADRLLAMDERKRPYNSLRGDYREVTEEEMEAFRMKRRNADDPMNSFKDRYEDGSMVD